MGKEKEETETAMGKGHKACFRHSVPNRSWKIDN